MPFYIRKSVSVGPFRFNLSKSGIGISTGVKGFRISSGPRGNYINIGSHGIYYRASLSSGKAAGQRKGLVSFSPAAPSLPQPCSTQLSQIETGDIDRMTDSSAQEILDHINSKLRSLPWYPLVMILGLVTVLMAGTYYPDKPGLLGLAAAVGLSATVIVWRLDSVRRSVVLMYDLGEQAQTSFEALTKSFDGMASAQEKWVLQAQGEQKDWKRHAGASVSVARTAASLEYKVPRVIKTNVSVPSITGGRQDLYFFPDVLLVAEGRKAAAVSYASLRIAWSDARFIEDGRVPGDSQIVGTTWKYVNKKGGPDRRFKNNRQLPILRYQELLFRSTGGLNKILQLSHNEDRAQFRSSVEQLAAAVGGRLSHTDDRLSTKPDQRNKD